MLPVSASTATRGVLFGKFKILNRALTCLSSIILSYLLLYSAMSLLHIIFSVLKWRSPSLDYRFLMLILLYHYMLIEFVWYLHYNKWLGSQ